MRAAWREDAGEAIVEGERDRSFYLWTDGLSASRAGLPPGRELPAGLRYTSKRNHKVP
jgi:hypothetical protein